MLFGKFTLPLGIFLFSASVLNAQLMYNAGTQVAVTGGGILYVGGAVENAAGLFSNAGQTTIKGYFRNGADATGGFGAGKYFVYGDWENNDVFTADQSDVVLTGNAQNITGTSVTTFYDLTLQTGGTVKTQTLDANVSHLLELNDCELATTDYNMNVTNASPAAVTRQNGYVSSTGPGRLIRATNSNSSYLFPTGWNNSGQVWYRPVEFTPSVSTAQTFAVRMAFGDASNDGYDINTKAGNVSAVNDRYYHLLKQTGSTAAADLSIYYNPGMDSMWNSIGRWQNLPQWEDLMNCTVTSGTPTFKVTKAAWTDNGQEPTILIDAKEVTTLFNFPNVFNPNSNQPENTTFHMINQFGLATLLSLRIYNRWGEPVFDSERDGVQEWNGQYQGKLQPMSNYVYVASVKLNTTNEVKNVSANLSLLW